jgi:aminopeptidase 2
MADREILTNTVKPVNYDLQIHSLSFEADYSFTGTLKIELAVEKPTDRIELNTLQLSIKNASMAGEVAKVSYDEKNQRAAFAFSKAVGEAGSTVSLDIEYTGTMNNLMVIKT